MTSSDDCARRTAMLLPPAVQIATQSQHRGAASFGNLRQQNGADSQSDGVEN